jgi:hypothetical protein
MMAAAVIFARTYEQRLALRDAGPQASARGSGRMGARLMQQQGTQSVSNTTGAQAATTTKTPPFVKRLTTAEITERRKDGCCFHCDELFTNGHKLVCKQLFIIELIHDDESPGDNDGADPTISIHVLTGIVPRSSRTMKVTVLINEVALMALLDFGSTNNFVDMDAVTCVGLSLTPRGNLRLAVANGDRISSPGGCRDVSISIDGKVFIIDCYRLALGAYDMGPVA